MVKIIAEIGCNHKGDIEIAKKLVKSAKICGADVAKFQKRNPKELLSREEYNAPHPNPINSYGKTYGEHREFLEFNIEQHKELKKYCEEIGIVYSTSVWDLTSAKEIVSINPKFIKIPSAQNTNFLMLQYICDNYNGEIHISFGMTSHEEENKIISFFENNGKANQLVIYSCTSGYPVEYKDICLFEICRLKDEYGKRVKSIGFSGHHIGISPDIAAITLGAEWVERHFTLDRTWKGTDHSASLEPFGLAMLVQETKNVYESLSYKKVEILDVEKVQRKKLKFKK